LLKATKLVAFVIVVRPQRRKTVEFRASGTTIFKKRPEKCGFLQTLSFVCGIPLSQFFNFADVLEVGNHNMATTATGRKRMTQSDVINHFAEKTGMKRAQIKELFEEIANLATSEVKSSGEFVLPGFGKLVRSERKAREGRNPATGETIQIPAKTTLKFRVGKAMKDSVLPRK